jgi:hypothetical protein
MYSPREYVEQFHLLFLDIVEFLGGKQGPG